jgi:hypothetical protein
MQEMTLGDLRLAPTGRTVRVTGQDAAKNDDVQGRAELFRVSSPTWKMTIAHNRWDSGIQDVKLHDRGTAPQRFDRLRSARRLGLMPSGEGSEFYVELKQVQMGENDHPTRRKVELADLSQGAGCDVKAVLTGMGAKVGTRQALIGDTSNHRTGYCVTFPRHAVEIAVVAYVLTRIAPFHHQIRA